MYIMYILYIYNYIYMYIYMYIYIYIYYIYKSYIYINIYMPPPIFSKKNSSYSVFTLEKLESDTNS